MTQPDADPQSVRKALTSIKSKYKLTSIELVKESGDAQRETDYVIAEINPKRKSKNKTFATDPSKTFKVEWSVNQKEEP